MLASPDWIFSEMARLARSRPLTYLRLHGMLRRLQEDAFPDLPPGMDAGFAGSDDGGIHSRWGEPDTSQQGLPRRGLSEADWRRFTEARSDHGQLEWTMREYQRALRSYYSGVTEDDADKVMLAVREWMGGADAFYGDDEDRDESEETSAEEEEGGGGAWADDDEVDRDGDVNRSDASEDEVAIKLELEICEET